MTARDFERESTSAHSYFPLSTIVPQQLGQPGRNGGAPRLLDSGAD